jgi:aryl-alcohol dehydrogenase-like predicted oxidoreductase
MESAESRTRNLLPKRKLGKTGEMVSIFGLGGQALLEQPDKADEAIALISRAIDLGVTYCDTARAYGPSEAYYGAVMKYRRREVFLTSKIYERPRDEAWLSIETSLRNLQTDYLDLIQIHSLRYPEELDLILRPYGALEACIEAREQGLVRYIGVTGHFDPQVINQAIRRFDFDTVLMPLNVADPAYLSFQRETLPLALERDLGIIAMKVPIRGRLLSEYLFQSIDPLLRYALSCPISTAIIGCGSMADLEKNVTVARNFRPLDEGERAAIGKIADGIDRHIEGYKKGIEDDSWRDYCTTSPQLTRSASSD